MRVFRATALSLFLLTKGTSAEDASSLEQTRQVLVAYHQETLQSVFSLESKSALGMLRDRRPESDLRVLYETRDPAVVHLGGVFWGMVCEATGASNSTCVPQLLQDLSNPDPKWRAFSCDALGIIHDVRTVPALLPLLRDATVILQTIGDATVSVAAAIALADMGRPDGIDVMLAHASRIPDYWQHAFLSRFKALSGQDFGNDLEAWKGWFARNR